VNILVDITPCSDENPVNLMSEGVLSVVILGSMDCDVTEIDASSLLLEGQVAPLHAKFLKGARGHTDLALKFAIEDVRNAIGCLQPGQTHEVWITGILKEGTPISGSDFILSVPNDHGRGRKGRDWKGHDKKGRERADDKRLRRRPRRQRLKPNE
jgi:hypothetical protein